MDLVVSWYPLAFAGVIALHLVCVVVVPPRNLSHLPRAPILALLRSYLSGEIESERINRLILPFAKEHGHSLVLVWAFGMWIVHVVDFEVCVPSGIPRYP